MIVSRTAEPAGSTGSTRGCWPGTAARWSCTARRGSARRRCWTRSSSAPATASRCCVRRGVETEAELAFCALADLLAPLLDALDALPAPQRTALEAALALGPPAPGERLAVCVATLGCCGRRRSRRPVLAVVDDVQWLDASSRECVEYVARRAGGAAGRGARRARSVGRPRARRAARAARSVRSTTTRRPSCCGARRPISPRPSPRRSRRRRPGTRWRWPSCRRR